MDFSAMSIKTEDIIINYPNASVSAKMVEKVVSAARTKAKARKVRLILADGTIEDYSEK